MAEPVKDTDVVSFEGSEVRVVGSPRIQQQINEALANLPVKRRGAVLAVRGDDESVRLVMAVKPADHWTVVGYLSHSLSPASQEDVRPRLEYGAEVRFDF